MPRVRRPLPSGAQTLALSQAQAFAGQALALGNKISEPTNAGAVLAYLVNAALAIELYFKTFMIAARGGHVTPGHDLLKLLDEFPPYLRRSFNAGYEAHPHAKTATVRLLALKLSSDAPDKPTTNFEGRYSSFDQAIGSLATTFVDARYFFEQLALPDWAVFAYPTDAISGVLQALDSTYMQYQAGAFAGEA